MTLQQKLNKIKKPFYTWSPKFDKCENPDWLLLGNKKKALDFLGLLNEYISLEGNINHKIKNMYSTLDRVFLNCINLIVFNIKITEEECIKDLKFSLFDRSKTQEYFYNNMNDYLNPFWLPSTREFIYRQKKWSEENPYFSSFPTLKDISVFTIKKTLAKILNLIKSENGYNIDYKPLFDIDSWYVEEEMGIAHNYCIEYYVEWNSLLESKLEKLSKNLPIGLRDILKLPELEIEFSNNTLKII